MRFVLTSRRETMAVVAAGVSVAAAVAVIVAAAGLAGPAGALAQSMSSSTTVAGSAAATGTVKAAPLGIGEMQVQAAPDAGQGQAALIVAIQLPASTKLPAMVRIPVPTGAQPLWVGEIVGLDVSLDPQRPYRTVRGTGGQVLEMTCEVTRTAQAEFALTEVPSAGRLTLKVDWVQAAAAPSTQFSVRMPAGVSGVEIAPTPQGAPATNALGETLYTLPVKSLKLGQAYPVSVSYRVGAATQTQPGGTGTGRILLWVLVIVLAVALVAIVVILRRQGRGSSEE